MQVNFQCNARKCEKKKYVKVKKKKRNKRKKKNCAAPNADNMNEREVEWMSWPFSWLRIWHGLSTSTELWSFAYLDYATIKKPVH